MNRVALAAGVVTAVVALVPLSASGPHPRRVQQPAATIDVNTVDAAFRQLLVDLPVVGAAGAIVTGDRVAWSGAYGLADIDAGRAIERSTIFHMGSVSKTVTAAALMRLWEDRAFQLDEDVNRYLAFPVRNPKFPDAPITFRMLLTHSSSISEIFQQAGRERIPNLYGTRDADVGLGDIVREFLVPGGKYYWDFNYRDAAPGTRFEYCNVGYALIGHLVERLSGMNFHAFVRTRLLDPVGMPDSTFRLADSPLARFAFPYRPAAGDARTMNRIAPFTWAGYTDGSLRTTVDDYGRFLALLLNEGRRGTTAVFKPDTIRTWLAPQHIPNMPPARGSIAREDYALGWPVHRLAGEVAYLHNGSGSGFGTYVFFVPALRTGGMLFTTGQPAPQDLFPRLERIITLMVDAARGM